MGGSKVKTKEAFLLFFVGAEVAAFFAISIFPAMAILSQNSQAAMRMSALLILLFGLSIGCFAILSGVWKGGQGSALDRYWHGFQQKHDFDKKTEKVLKKFISSVHDRTKMRLFEQSILTSCGFIITTGLLLIVFTLFSRLEAAAFVIGGMVALLAAIGMVKARATERENAILLASLYSAVGLSLALIASLLASIIRFLA